jgi:hypothetical protein
MNSTPQLDLHPDAESLNAFVEQALGAVEREQILSHLAGCGRCRQVVYLAQAAAEVELPATVAASRPWFAGWRWAWVPAAALAAVAALAVTFYPWPGGFRTKHAAMAPEVAKVVPQSEIQAPASVLPEKRSAETARTAIPPATFKSATKSAQSGVLPPSLAEGGQLAEAPAGETGAALSFHGESYAPLTASGAVGSGSGEEQAIGGQANAALFKPQPVVAPWPQQTLRKRRAEALERNAAATPASQANLRAMDSPQTVRTTSFAAAMPRSGAQPAAGNSLAVSMKRPMVLTSALAGIGGLKLPNGTMPVSAAVASRQTLALDTAGALFLSEDAGLHWEPVTQQWTGRAIEVRKVKAASDAAAPAEAFELMNEAGLTWTSADGRGWKAK